MGFVPQPNLHSYDSFGNIISDSDPSFDVPFGFAGGLHDRDTGLVRFGYRDYDPEVGRWTAKDPIFFKGNDTDLYGYVQNNPINAVDPWGLFAPFGGPGFTNVQQNLPPSWSEQVSIYQKNKSNIFTQSALPGQFGTMGVVAISDFTLQTSGFALDIFLLIRYGATPVFTIDNRLYEPPPANAAELQTNAADAQSCP